MNILERVKILEEMNHNIDDSSYLKLRILLGVYYGKINETNVTYYNRNEDYVEYFKDEDLKKDIFLTGYKNIKRR